MILSESLSSSIISSLESLPHNVVVINSHGVIKFTNREWKSFIQACGLIPCNDWIGVYFYEFMQELILFPDQWAKLYHSIEHVLRREHLVFRSEFTIQTINHGNRIFCLETYPLLTEPYASEANFIISLYDVGPFIEETIPIASTSICSAYRLPVTGLIPICASCKSIRNHKDEWNTIEHFLKHQLQFQFTHDICPDCIRALYPQYAGAFKR